MLGNIVMTLGWIVVGNVGWMAARNEWSEVGTRSSVPHQIDCSETDLSKHTPTRLRGLACSERIRVCEGLAQHANALFTIASEADKVKRISVFGQTCKPKNVEDLM
ncbi:hypothetical protein EUGRSUZ_I02636 [Eucalyptus grandis]|uniref:Uncharacterized protein n=2 Tax=Eucalyptus grandis TaxID=71139 RepID=A0ACC3JJS2_EUCGR|nr:hypothetical protein EUGRSUZ_I02636 [Eucalyptus grandis]